MSTQSKNDQLNKLRTKLENNFNKLPLVNKKSDIVPPEGNANAELMFIGEAAGYHEHVQRRPFVGVAGKLLTRLLEEHGLKREDVWISNIIKARPPENRDPKPEEIEAYKPYLDQEIEIIEPRIIITLGRFSMGKFIQNVFISQIHGQPRWITWKGKRLLVFPMYHPAAALRNGKVMMMFRQDFSKLVDTLKKLNNPQPEEPREGVEKKVDEKKPMDEQLQLI